MKLIKLGDGEYGIVFDDPDKDKKATVSISGIALRLRPAYAHLLIDGERSVVEVSGYGHTVDTGRATVTHVLTEPPVTGAGREGEGSPTRSTRSVQA